MNVEYLDRCTHPWRRTTYGSNNPERNGTVCVLCGAKITPTGWRRSQPADGKQP